MKTSSSLFLLLIFSLIIIRIIPIQANPALGITVGTDKQKYYIKETVQVYGNLTLDGELVTNGLVGLQIQNSKDKLILIRTLSTGNPPPETPYVLLEYVVPCDSEGNPQSSFKRGNYQFAHFKISVANLDTAEPREVLLTIITYYGDNTPFGFASIQTTISAGSNPSFIVSIPLSEDSVLGSAMVYANAYTDWPQLGGTPYCSEVNAAFQIIDDALGAAQTSQSLPLRIQQANETANYNTTFKLPRMTPYGNCTAYVTSRYFGESTFNSTTFKVYILGDLGGGLPPQFFLFDGIVDGKDKALFLLCYKGQGP